MNLSISIVSHYSDTDTLTQTLISVERALSQAKTIWPEIQTDIHFIDNALDQPAFKAMEGELQKLQSLPFVNLYTYGNNINHGYGGGHNLCLEKLNSDFHLVLNPDVILDENFFITGVSFLNSNPDIVLLAPHATDEQGEPLHLCKRHPSVLNLLLRGFMPEFVKKIFAGRLAHYEMQDLANNNCVNKEVLLCSGCCMLLQTTAFKKVNGFDPCFFLYFEDYDLSLRLRALGKLAYHPELVIVHLGGFSARKGLKHIWLFAKSGVRFFNLHGWKLI